MQPSRLDDGFFACEAIARMRRLAIVTLLSLAACAAASDSGETAEAESVLFARSVVETSSKLALTNPQKETVTWPLWGGAIALDGTVQLRVSLASSGTNEAGLLIGARQDPGSSSADTTAAVELAWDGHWKLRELAGETVKQEVTLASGDAVLAVSTTSITANGHTLTLSKALPKAAGIYVHLAAGANLTVNDVAIAQAASPSTGPGAALRDLATARKIDMGTAADVWPPLSDAHFESMLGEEFGLVAPTDFYWDTTRGEDEDFFFLPADLIVNYAQVHHQKVDGYFLVWDFELPKWVKALKSNPTKLGQVFDDHITTTVSRYRGKVDAWAVVNEAIWGPDETGGGPSQLAETLWSTALGPTYIERAFNDAHAADPNATLFYNETGAESLGAKSDFVYATLKDLVARHVPVGGVGFQFHLDASKEPSMSDVKANFERFGGLGLEVRITELDVTIAHATGTTAEKQQLQAKIYSDVLAACLAVPACRSYTVFGFGDKYAWDVLKSGTPLMFDKDFAPKPAFFAVQSELSTR